MSSCSNNGSRSRVISVCCTGSGGNSFVGSDYHHYYMSYHDCPHRNHIIVGLSLTLSLSLSLSLSFSLHLSLSLFLSPPLFLCLSLCLSVSVSCSNVCWWICRPGDLLGLILGLIQGIRAEKQEINGEQTREVNVKRQQKADAT